MISNTNRIAKNTLLLYFRMMLIMIISLYTVRLVLNALGVVDYGIFNVVAGVIVMFSFLSNTLASTSQRYFAFEIGRNNKLQLKWTFNITVIIYIIISVVILILAETIGLWFLNNMMVIPSYRMEAANWIYQFSIFSFIITTLTIPFNALIIARENMKVYAYVGVIESLLKLLIVYLLVFMTYDKLILYAVLMFLNTCLISSIYCIYCWKKYEESQLKLYWNKNLFKTLLNFSGWNLFGGIAGVLHNQGVNILLNIFFGPIVNAARGIAFQVSTAVNQFVLNFTTAVNPQITKYYASGKKNEMMALVFGSSKFSYFLLLILSIPVLLETNYLITLWLKIVPDYVILFCQLVIINALIDSLSFSLQTTAQATGDIRFYQIVVGGILLLNLPISFVFLKFGYPPKTTIYISIFISIISLFLRLFILKSLVSLSIKEYFNKVLLVVTGVTFLSYIIPVFLIFILDESFLRFILVGITTIIASLTSIYLTGITAKERVFFNKIIKARIFNKIRF